VLFKRPAAKNAGGCTAANLVRPQEGQFVWLYKRVNCTPVILFASCALGNCRGAEAMATWYLDKQGKAALEKYLASTFKRCACVLRNETLVDAACQPCTHSITEAQIRNEMVNYEAKHTELEKDDVDYCATYVGAKQRASRCVALQHVSCFSVFEVTEETGDAGIEIVFPMKCLKPCRTLYGLVPIAPLGGGPAAGLCEQSQYEEVADRMCQNKREKLELQECERQEDERETFVKTFMQASMTRCDCKAPAGVVAPDTTQLNGGRCPHTWQLGAIGKAMNAFALSNDGVCTPYVYDLFCAPPRREKRQEAVRKALTHVQCYTVGVDERPLALRFQEFGGTGLELQGFLPLKKRKR
jgi:hypothetical protein